MASVQQQPMQQQHPAMQQVQQQVQVQMQVQRLAVGGMSGGIPKQISPAELALMHQQQQQQQQMQQGGTHHIKKGNSRYKTELCRAFQEKGYCKYSDKCQFAHGHAELRQMQRHPKYKTEMCRTFHNTGLCPYGPRCHFIHESSQQSQSPSLSSPPPNGGSSAASSSPPSASAASADMGGMAHFAPLTLEAVGPQSSNSSLSVSFEVTNAFPHESDNIPSSPYRPSTSNSSPDSRMSLSPTVIGRSPVDLHSPAMYHVSDTWSPGPTSGSSRMSRHGSSGGSPELPAYVPDMPAYGQDPAHLFVPATFMPHSMRGSPSEFTSPQHMHHQHQQQAQQLHQQQFVQQQQQQHHQHHQHQHLHHGQHAQFHGQYSHHQSHPVMFKFSQSHIEQQHVWDRAVQSAPYDMSKLEPPASLKARVISPSSLQVPTSSAMTHAQQQQQQAFAQQQQQQMMQQHMPMHAAAPVPQQQQQQNAPTDSLDAAARRLPVFSALGNL